MMSRLSHELSALENAVANFEVAQENFDPQAMLRAVEKIKNYDEDAALDFEERFYALCPLCYGAGTIFVSQFGEPDDRVEKKCPCSL